MQVTVEAGEGLQKRLLVNLPADQVNVRVEAKLKDLSRTARMDGFRPGKVPMRLLRARYLDQIKQDVWGELIQSSFYDAARQQDLKPVGLPSIDLREDEADGGLAYTATFDVMPEFVLADLSAHTIKRPAADVADADIDAMLEKLRKQRTEWVAVDRAAQDGDAVVLDFVGKMDGEEFAGGKANDFSLVIGSGNMIPGFEDGLVGLAAGGEKTLELKFPDEYHAPQLAGKTVSFDVKVSKVSEPKLPEVNEAFVKSLGVEDGSLDTLRAEVRANMERELKQKIRTSTKAAVMDVLLAAHEINVPKSLVNDECVELKKQAERDMARSGHKSSLDLPLSVFESQAERRVKLGMLVGEIIKVQKIALDSGRVDAAIEEQAAAYENPQEIVDWYKANPQARGSVENVVMEDQVVDWVLTQLKIEDQGMTFDELLAVNAG